MKHQDHLSAYIAQSLRDNWNRPALTNFQGVTFQYHDVARKIAKLHILFEHAGIKRGDKIALCGKNSSQWAVAFFAVITYGAVAVPILHEFKPDNVHHLVTHSEARLLFTDQAIWENLDPELMKLLDGAVLLQDFSLLLSRSRSLTEGREHLNELFGKKYPERFRPTDVQYRKESSDELALINYTSGSTGFSKGVMLSYGSLWSNVQYCIDGLNWLNPGDGIVSMLPMAHMYGLVIDTIHPFVKGCHVNFLTRTPSPRVIMEAFAEVRPKLIVTVPLIIEKIIKTKVFPLLEKPLMKLMLHVPFVDDRLLGKIKERLTEVFGGQIRQIIIGGAGLNHDVEKFLRRIEFPFTVGYGMTECGPLISYTPWERQRPGSCGQVVDRMTIKCDSPDPANVPGVLYVKGRNVMQGYFKNPEATAEVLAPDGWMSTGDIGNIDAEGYIYIRGRDKNMILGPSGQNIYPEEIEQKLNNMPYVAESVVVENGAGKLVALVYPDLENVNLQKIPHEQLQTLMESNIKTLNQELPGYSQITGVKIMNEEFEKTPKRSIKRYIYMHQA